eukprot:Gb_23430 [translate_table: standard]
MDRRNWPWRKKSSEKITLLVEQGDTSPSPNPASVPASVPAPAPPPPPKAHEEQDVSRTQWDHTPFQELEDRVKILNKKLSTALAESTAKDDLVKQHAKVAEEAVSGWEKAEAEAVALKEQLDAALHLKVAAEDRVSHLDGALKECMRQLRHVREEQEQRIHEVTMKKVQDLDRVQLELEEKLAEASQKLLEAAAENTVLRKSMQERTQTIEELSERKTYVEGDVKVLQVRLDSVEKENSALKYELHVLNKELEIRNEEREYNRRTADAANKQHMESTKKIAKLEAECQRLRVLVRKRLPGPAAVAQMKMEVETLGKETTEWKRKRLHGGKGAGAGSLAGESVHNNAQENSMRQIHVLSEQILAMEEEAKVLKQTLTKRNNELQASRVMCARTAGKLSQVEAQMEALYRSHGITRTGDTAVDVHVEMSKGIITSDEPSIVSISEDGGNGDEASCAESWASALISELAQIKKENTDTVTNKAFDSSEFNLMNDFVEMERLAAMSDENAVGSANISGKEDDKLIGPTIIRSEQQDSVFSLGEWSGPLEGTPAARETNANLALDQSPTIQSRSSKIEVDHGSLKELLGMVFEAHEKSQNMDEVMEKVKAAIAKAQYSTVEQVDKAIKCMNSPRGSSSDGLHNGSLQGIAADSFSPRSRSQGSSSEEETGAYSSFNKMKTASLGTKLNASIHKILRLIEGFVQSNFGDHDHSKTAPHASSCPQLFRNSSDLPGYTIRVLQWQNSEFDAIIQSLVKICSDLLHGKEDIVEFVEEVASTLDWLVNHFFSLQDVSSIRATIKKRMEWEEDSHSASESDAGGTNSPDFRQEKTKCEDGSLILALPNVGSKSTSPIVNASSQLEEAQKLLAEKENIECQLNEEINRLRGELSNIMSEKKEVEERLQLVNTNFEAMKFQIQESEQSISKLQSELSATMETRHSIEDQLASQISMNGQLDSKLKSVEIELNQAQEKLSSLQAKLEDQHSFSQELESKCVDLQLQLESVRKQETSRDVEASYLHHSADEVEMRLRKEREIAAAAEKLAECQQTIFVLGKQLKALASPSDSPDISSSSSGSPTLGMIPSGSNQHASLFDHIQADSKSDETREHFSQTELPKTKVLWPRTEKEKNPQQELVVARRRNTGLLYGWQMPTDASRNNVAHEEQVETQSNSHKDASLNSPAKSPGRFLSIRTKATGYDSLKSASSGEAGSTSPNKYSHSGGGFSRFFSRTRSGH